MLFNSFDFAVFLPVVFFIYWFLTQKNLRLQNLLIVAASLFFYGWWDWRFLSLLIISSIIDFTSGIAISNQSDKNRKRIWLTLSIAVNLGMLGFFKYFNFFIDNFTTAFTFFGMPFQKQTLEIVLPVGISFYTFQTMSYTIDVYRQKLEPTRDFIAFLAYVSFFPQLVAGPIERASNLLPQFFVKRTFDYHKGIDGMRQILWGFFKKVVVADNCAEVANQIFNNSHEYSGSTLLLGAFFFAFQIYGDFSGYSDIAIGTARLFGFTLMRNFAFPYFSKDIAEFWRRWHISLSTWFRDYLYVPLGGSRSGTAMMIRNTLIIFVVSGFWHGANWTFIAWGLLNAIYFIPLVIAKKNRQNMDIAAHGKLFASPREIMAILLTFFLTLIAWIFFRAENLGQAISILKEIFSPTFFTRPEFTGSEHAALTLLLIAILIVTEWLGRHGAYALSDLEHKIAKPYRWAIYFAVIFLIGMFMQTTETPFIYFQF